MCVQIKTMSNNDLNTPIPLYMYFIIDPHQFSINC